MDKDIQEEVIEDVAFTRATEGTKILSDKNNSSDSEDDLYCPALPPHLSIQPSGSAAGRTKVVGPSLPSNYIPEPDTHESSDSDCEFIGPMPPTSAPDPDYKLKEIELRSQRMKDALTKKDDKSLVRESWMLELPSDKPNLFAMGFGPRKFKRQTPHEKGDRSSWTDLPGDKERKKQIKESEVEEEEEKKDSIETTYLSKRDEELSSYVEDYNSKKRVSSLVDLHQNKKPKVNSITEQGRRPFSREEDLSVNKFDESQKNTIMKKAAQLNDRFSKGKQKFL